MPYCLSNHHHPSRVESNYCNWLLARKQSGEISHFRLYPNFRLHISDKPYLSWTPDFLVWENDGTATVHEAKGFNRSDDSFRLRLRAFLLEYNIPVIVNKRPAYLSPAGKLFADGILRPKKGRKLVKSWNRKLKRWETVKK